MSHDTRTWRTKQTTNDGLPLFLRYPENADFDSQKSSFPVLAVITHELSKVSPNGLPEPEYNDSLLEFDSEIRGGFEQLKIGQTVLVETFGGKRKYYIYVAPEVCLDEIIVSLSKRYPHERLSWSVHPDSEWSFIKRYAKEWLLT
jgi:hypothetical protein